MHTRSKGFTLIEIIVVISIISFLSSIVYSAANRAREKGRLEAGKYFDAQVMHVAGDQVLLNWDFDDCGNSGATTAKDKSAFSNDGTLTNGPVWNSSDTPSGAGCSVAFDGVNDYIISSKNLGISGDATFTMCAWIKGTGATWSTVSNDYPSFMGNNTTGISNQGLSFTVNGGRPAVDFWANRFRATNALTLGKWYYVCGVKSPGLISTMTKLYIDGAQVSGAVEGTDGSPNIADAPAVAGRLDGTRWFTGLIDEPRFYAKLLVGSEIEKLYLAGLERHLAEAR